MNDQYQALYASFRWLVPNHFNIADVCCHRWAANSADGRRIAIYAEDETGNREVWTYGRLAQAVNQFANGLARMQVEKGGRVGIVIAGQRPETAVTHLATYSVGAIAVPLPSQLTQTAFETLLRDAQVQVVVTDQASHVPLLAAIEKSPALQHLQVVGIDFANERVLSWRSLLARQISEFKCVTTLATDPAVLLYTAETLDAMTQDTSANTSDPASPPNTVELPPPSQGVLLPHCALIGNLPGFVASQDWFPKPSDVFFSSVNWAQATSLMGALLPTLYFGHPIVGISGPCPPARIFQVLERYQVTNTFFLPPTLTAMMQAIPAPGAHYRLALRAIMSTEESLSHAVFTWCHAALGVLPNEMFGCTEAHYLIGNSRQRWSIQPGSMGHAYPGHQVAIIDAQGQLLPPGKTGEIVLNRYDPFGHPDPVMFLGYWRKPAETEAKFSNDWYRTGVLAYRDQAGYFWYAGHDNARLQSAGHAINPTEIEHSLRQHPAVAHTAVVLQPTHKGDVWVKAYVVLTNPFVLQSPAALVETLQKHVQTRLSRVACPKEIVFLDTLPRTALGTLQRHLLP